MPRHTKVLKLHILKPGDFMNWKELGDLLREARYRVFRLANMALSEAYLAFHQKRAGVEHKQKKISELNRELKKTLEDEKSKRAKKSAEELSAPFVQFAKDGALPANVVDALSSYKLKALTSNTKWSDVLKGKSALPTFRSDMAIPVRCDKDSQPRLKRTQSGDVVVKLALRLKPYPCVVIAIKRDSLGDGQRAILDRLLDNADNKEDGWRQRCFEIKEDKQSRKWHLFVTYDFPAESPQNLSKERIVGVDVGVSCPLFAAIGNGHARLGRRAFGALGARMRALQNQTVRRRREIQRGGRTEISSETARSGHGRARKLMPIEKLEGRIDSAYKTLNHQMSAAVVKFAKDNGAGVIQMENLEGLKETLAGTFIGQRWRYEELQRFIAYKAKEAGIEFRKVSPKYTSRRCSECGHIHMEFDRKFRDENRNGARPARFVCPECGYKADPDYNAARNLATDGIEKLITEQMKKQDIKSKSGDL